MDTKTQIGHYSPGYKEEKEAFRIFVLNSIVVDEAFIQKEFQKEYSAGSNGKFETHWAIDENGILVYIIEQASIYSSWTLK